MIKMLLPKASMKLTWFRIEIWDNLFRGISLVYFMNSYKKQQMFALSFGLVSANNNENSYILCSQYLLTYFYNISKANYSSSFLIASVIFLFNILSIYSIFYSSLLPFSSTFRMTRSKLWLQANPASFCRVEAVLASSMPYRISTKWWAYVHYLMYEFFLLLLRHALNHSSISQSQTV